VGARDRVVDKDPVGFGDDLVDGRAEVRDRGEKAHMELEEPGLALRAIPVVLRRLASFRLPGGESRCDDAPVQAAKGARQGVKVPDRALAGSSHTGTSRQMDPERSSEDCHELVRSGASVR